MELVTILFYTIILIVGIIYLIVAFFTEFEFLLGKMSFGLPYSLTAWGLMGILGASDLQAFLLGFLLVFLITSYLYSKLHVTGFELDKYLLQEARVTVAIPKESNRKGEIVFEADGGMKHIMAAPYDDIIKPIPKNSMVRIIDVKGHIALVSTEIQIPKHKTTSKNIKYSMIKFFNSITPKNKVTGVCMICFGRLIGASDGFTCPSCVAVAHTYHITEWVKIKGFCPNCRIGLELKKNKIRLMLSPPPPEPEFDTITGKAISKR